MNSRFIKIISLLLAAVMVYGTVTLVSCGNDAPSPERVNNEETNDGEASKNVKRLSDKADLTIEDVNAVKNELFGYLNNNGLKKFIDVAEYGLTKTNEKDFFKINGVQQLEFEFELDDDSASKYVTFKTDKNVKIDGADFTLPISAEDLNKEGWYAENTPGLTIGYKEEPMAPFYNDKTGRYLACHVCNTTPGTEITLDKAAVHKFYLDPQYNSKIEPEIVLCEKLTARSSLKDVIDSLGAPLSFNFRIEYESGKYDRTECTVYYVKEYGIQHDRAYFIFNVDDNVMTFLGYGIYPFD